MTVARAPSLRSWAFLDVFTVRGLERRSIPTWDTLDALRALAMSTAGTRHAELAALLREWDDALVDVGGDPAFRDWSGFRPLRLSREEDWSDWLCHLIETSTHGFLARELLDDPAARVARVDREVSTYEGFRADLVVHWRDGRASHVEVKVGDMSFEKTFGTAAALRRHFEHARAWTDHILLPDQHGQTWAQVAGTARADDPHIAMLTWTEVAVALRSAIRTRREAIDWRVWGAAFVGSIEQKLLGLPSRERQSADEPGFTRLLFAPAHLEILRRAWT